MQYMLYEIQICIHIYEIPLFIYKHTIYFTGFLKNAWNVLVT